MDIYQHDDFYRKQGFSRIAGIDEAGRGPLAGPVVAAAVILKENIFINGLRDSKKVPEKEREALYNAVKDAALDIGIGIIGPEEIDNLNILKATRLAMQTAVESLSIIPDLLIIDAVKIPTVSIKQISYTKCESISASVAAASIIAKVTRDRIMLDFHKIYPQYHFDRHKGYSTSEHIELIRIYGPCPIHRKSFCRVKTLQLPF